MHAPQIRTLGGHCPGPYCHQPPLRHLPKPTGRTFHCSSRLPEYSIGLILCCIENSCPYCWQCHTCRYFSPIPAASTAQVAPRPGRHPDGQQDHTRQVHPFHPLRHSSYMLPQPTSSRSVFSKFSIRTLTDDTQSYVGGLYLDQGLSTVEKWLKLLFKPYVTEAYIRVRTQHGLPPLPVPISPPLAPSTSVSSASSGLSSSVGTTSSKKPASEGSRKCNGQISTPAHRNSHHHPHASGTPTTTGHLALFNQQLQKTRRDVEWVYDDCVAEGTITTPIWAVRVEVDGEVFGRGRGGTKKAARNEAAKEGLVRMGIVV